MTNVAIEAMAHRNRWFTVLKTGGSFHGYVKLPDGILPKIGLSKSRDFFLFEKRPSL
jgi:hypothetical protein